MGAATVGGSGGEISTAGGNFAFVLTEHPYTAAPVRFTTWGMAAQAALAYQSRSAGNVVYVGNSGYVYRVDPTVCADDGSNIAVIYTTGVLPWLDEQIRPSEIEAEKILVRIMVVLQDDPGTVQVLVTATDVDDETNVVTRTVSQTGRLLLVRLGLRARRWVISLSASVGCNYNIVQFTEEVIIKDKQRKGDL